MERCKIGESLQSNAKVWLKAGSYDVDKYLKLLLDTNDIDCLPDDVKEKYVISDCYVYVPLTDKLVKEWQDKINATLYDIESREKDYGMTKNEKYFWDTEESVKSQSYYLSTLCGYSPNLHLPYKEYLEKLEAAKNGENTFNGVGMDVEKEQPYFFQPDIRNYKHQTINNDDADLSWLDEI